MTQDELIDLRSKISKLHDEVESTIPTAKLFLKETAEGIPKVILNEFDYAKAETDLLNEADNYNLKIFKQRRLKNALARIRNNCFGICFGCGEEIEMSRLAVHPEAFRCIYCQEYMERERDTHVTIPLFPWQKSA